MTKDKRNFGFKGLLSDILSDHVLISTEVLKDKELRSLQRTGHLVAKTLRDKLIRLYEKGDQHGKA